MGVYPGHSHLPMQLVGRRTVQAMNDGKLKFAIVDPIMHGGAHGTNLKKSKWIPINPQTDGALLMGMMRWILENNRQNNDFLSSPSLEAAKKKGFNSWTNASYLVIVDKEHPNYRKMLRADDVGISVPAPSPAPSPNPNPEPQLAIDYIVINAENGKPELNSGIQTAQPFFDGIVTGRDGKPIRVKTSLTILKENAFKYTLDEYSQFCFVSKETIIELAQEYTSHGTKAGIVGLGNSVGANGFYMAFGEYMMSALVGAYNKKGGVLTQPPSYKSIAPGPRYNLGAIPGAPKSGGVTISRVFPYEKTSEFKKKKATGQNPYPSKLPWYGSHGTASDNQTVYSLANGYPYQAKILMVWWANPLFSTPSAGRPEVIEQIKKRVPLIICCDAFMSETTAISDYIIPDTTQFESWGLNPPYSHYELKATQLRWPVVKPMTAQIGEGRYACFENYIIDVAKKVGIPGFGDKAIPGVNPGEIYAFNRPEDFFLKAVANVAYDEKPVPDITSEELQAGGLKGILDPWQDSLKDEEWAKVAYVMARGGRFEDGDAFVGDNHKYAANNVPINIYNESVANARNSITGEFHEGSPLWRPELFHDGTSLDQKYPTAEWPFKVVNAKGKFRSATMLSNIPILHDLQKANAVLMNREDATKLGIKDGDNVKITAATGGEVIGRVAVSQSVAQGTLGYYAGYGHWESGAREYRVDGKKMGGDSARGAGILLARISLMDPSVEGVYGYADPVSGAPSRQGGRYKVERV